MCNRQLHADVGVTNLSTLVKHASRMDPPRGALFSLQALLGGPGGSYRSLKKPEYSNFRNYAPPFDEKGGIFAEKVFSVFSERVFWACFGIVM